MANQKKIPIHDPTRTTTPQAAARADRRKRYSSMTPEEILRETPDRELNRYVRRGAPLAIAEQERRMAGVVAMHELRSPASMIMPDPKLDIGV